MHVVTELIEKKDKTIESDRGIYIALLKPKVKVGVKLGDSFHHPTLLFVPATRH